MSRTLLKFNDRSRNRGMSLVEMIVYMSILVVLVGVIVNTVLALTTHYRAVRNTREIEDTAIAVLDSMSRQIRSSDQIIADSSVFNSTHGALTLVSTDPVSGQSTTTSFYEANGKVMISENGMELGPLSKESVTVVGFILTRITTARSTAVRVELSLQSDQAAPFIISKNFYNTVVLRGSY